MVKKANTYLKKNNSKKKMINHCSVAVLFWEAMAAIPSDAWVNPPRIMPAFVSKLKGVFLFSQANWGHSEINKRLKSYLAVNPQHLQFSLSGVTPVQSSADGNENNSSRTYPTRFATPHNGMSFVSNTNTKIDQIYKIKALAARWGTLCKQIHTYFHISSSCCFFI